MLSEYFVQIGLIIFPITAYQVWVFGFSNKTNSINTIVMGIYGGGSAILCQLLPVHIFGITENFQCVPIIVSILYGKRKAGLLSIGILSLYQIVTFESSSLIHIIAIFIYSIIPLILCLKFEQYDQRKRFIIAQLITFSTIVVEVAFLAIVYLSLYGINGLIQLSHYFKFLCVAAGIQIIIMTVLFFLVENIIENNRIRKRHETLIHFNPIGVCVFDNLNRFVSVNPAYERLTGYKDSELVGKSRLMLWPEESQNLAKDVLAYTRTGRAKVNVEAEFQHKDGHKIPVQFTLVPMVEKDVLIGHFAMITDLTEAKATEELMRNSDKLTAIGELAAGMAHEIRNPLTSIKGFLQLLFNTSQSQSYKKYYDITMSELSRIEGIISEMLVLAKPHADYFQPFNLKEKLEEVEQLLRGEANMQNVDLITEYCQENPTILGDGNQIKQVFLNLGKNAIEAMPDGGTLRISLIAEKGNAVANFVDNGEGITEDVLKKMGEPFFTTKEKGTGLGLLISKRIVSKHNGILDIQSKVGEGTTISVLLPIASDQNG